MRVAVAAFAMALSSAAAFGQQPVIPYVGPNPWGSTNPSSVTTATDVTTYSAADVSIANTGAGDVWCVSGSATKTVYLLQVHLSGLATSAIVADVSVIKRSTADTGGTAIAETAVPHDSTNVAATASVKAYSVSPTAGTAVGSIMAHKIALGVQGNTATTTEAFFKYGDQGQQPIILHGTAENVCVNVSAPGAGGSWAIYSEWMEK